MNPRLRNAIEKHRDAFKEAPPVIGLPDDRADGWAEIVERRADDEREKGPLVLADLYRFLGRRVPPPTALV